MKKIFFAVFVFTLCFILCSCSFVEKEAERRKNEREECFLDKENATVFSCSGKEYVILKEQTERENIGSWIGYIQKVVFIDKNYNVLETRDIKFFGFSENNLPENTLYSVKFFNIYKEKNNDSNLIIDINGAFHIAAEKNKSVPTGKIISYRKSEKSSEDSLKISDKNCTQIIWKNNIYQISERTIEENKTDVFIGYIGEYKIFDHNTKIEISKADLKKIELYPGRLSNQKRVSWTYGSVFNINEKSIAVEINGKYFIADLIR
ncbi:MAG: NisI/SpaI family lantibiotic immunity lipoprotein [Thermotogae bacterium]|nr:NisI/SpaI family lantibiotic immunity lipoprotein [Thermotogota bacterium]